MGCFWGKNGVFLGVFGAKCDYKKGGFCAVIFKNA
nr:MAG TPA: Peptide methionine sulfoxide reductase [Caudoviricetes sp.]